MMCVPIPPLFAQMRFGGDPALPWALSLMLGLMLFGAALWFAAGLVCQQRIQGQGDTIRWLLRAVAALLITVAVMGLLLILLWGFGIPLFFVGGLVLFFAFLRYYHTERRLLVDVLALAAERQLPLALALRGFAADRNNRLGHTAREVAAGLEQGLPLSAALEQSRAIVPTDVRLAIRIGEHHQQLSAALAQSRERYGRFDALWLPVLMKLIYLWMIALTLVSILTFMMLKIIPTFDKLFKDFELSLPRPTEMVIWLSREAADYSWVWLSFLFWGGLILSFFVCLPLLLYSSGYVSWEPFLLRRFLRRLDTAVILRALAHAVQHGLPLVESVRHLAAWYPRKSVRRLLDKAGHNMTGGRDWAASLEMCGLLRSPEVALLQASERAHNLQWAMLEIADGAERRFIYRMQAAISVVFPLLLLGMGCVVFLVSVAMLLPLVKLIINLSV